MSGSAHPSYSVQACASEILNASNDAIAAVDGKLRLVFLNLEAERRLGKTLAAVAGRHLSELVPDGQARELASHCREAITLKQPRVFEQQGEERTYEFDIRPTESGGAAIWFREITERKRTEEKLRASDERLRMLIANVKDYAMFAMDPQGRVISWNAGAERILGYCENEILGQSSDCVFTPEDRVSDAPGKEMAKALADGRAEDERWHVRKDGTRFYASGILTPLWDNGELRGFSKILRDFTERRKTEEAVLEAQKLESVGVLAGGVAHDFNNLLAVILGNISIVLEELRPGDPNRRFLEAAMNASDKAHRLTDQLLAYAGKGGFWKQQVHVSEVISEMTDLLRAAVPKKTVLQFKLAADLERTEADPAQVQQLVTNLVSNAAEAIGVEQRGTVTVRTGMKDLDPDYISRNIRNGALLPGRYVSIEVEDTGVGIPDEVKSRIFDPFFTTKFTGRGLGLAAVSGIVRSLGGAVEVETTPGKGSRFRIFLPVGSPAEPAAPPEQAAQTIAPAPGTVLVVDDEPMVLDAATRILQRRGFEVLAAANADEAVKLLDANRHKVGVALLDLRMPDISGHELLPMLRKVRSDLRVIVASGYTEDETRALFSGQEVTGFIHKPYTSAELAHKVERAIASGE